LNNSGAVAEISMTASDKGSPVSAGRAVWTEARNLISLHGGLAPLYALQSVDLSIERGDFAAARQWRLVWRAVEALLSKVPPSPFGYH
jgi:hypothetical protein